MSSQIERLVAEFRSAVLAEETAATQRVLAAYDPVRVELIQRIDALAKIIVERELTASEVMRFDRAEALFAQVEEEIARLAGITYTATNQAQEQMVAMAVTHAFELASASAGTATIETVWNRVNTGAVEAFVGRMSDGSPLIDTLGQFGKEARPKLVDALQRGIAQGTNPRGLAAELTKVIDGDAWRLLRIARTESLQSMRAASSATYAANSDVLQGTIWVCALSARTCAACLAMSGTIHPVDYAMESHPSCRCSLAPWVKGSSKPGVQSGEEWFANQPAATQRAILGPSAHKAYQQGDVALSDFVQRDDDPRWGVSIRQGGLDHAKGQAAERERRAA